MTAIAYKRQYTHTPHESPKLQNRPYSGRSWQWYVVPTPMLADLIDKHIPEMMKQVPEMPVIGQGETGWRDYLSMRVASIRRCTFEATQRRVHDITHRKTRVVRVDFADATCLALGIDLDRDTNIPTLPGNIAQTKALIEDRAAVLGVPLTPEDHERFTLQAFRLALLIIAYPHKSDRLVPLAPFDCFRAIAR